MKLSILIPTVHNRRNTFLPRILNSVYSQYDKLTTEQQSQVEILTLMDNKTIMLGDKRNVMIDLAQGDYVVFVDDDDRLADDYIISLLNATSENKDVISFQADVTINGGEVKKCYYSKENRKDFNSDTAYYRIPNHICCVKKSIASQVQFPSLIYGEDAAYSKLLLPLLQSETTLDKVLYYYDFNADTTETQTFLVKRVAKQNRTHIPSLVDIVILSNGKDGEFQQMTQNTIDSIVETTKDYAINIIVMEQNIDVEYEHATTVNYDYEFNYNKVANHGARLGISPYIMIANNDLIFKKNWLFELLKVNHPVMSTKCPVDKRQADKLQNTEGYDVGALFSGWCFMIKRDIFDQINGFDEDFHFWYADNATVEQIKEIGVTHMLVTSSLVEHLGSRTLRTLSKEESKSKTSDLTEVFNKKYNK